MAGWFGRERRGQDVGNGPTNADDCPTGEISAALIAEAAGQPRHAAEVERLRAQRAELIQLCLYAIDRARSAGVVERMEEGLAGVGVTAMRPDGAAFDPGVHEAGGTVATDDAGLDGVVAETEVVGFSDNGTVLRAPIVTVYSARNGVTP